MDYQYTAPNPNGAYYGQAPEPQKKGLAIASLVLGIVSIVLCCFFGWIFGIVGAILGIVALVTKQSKGMAIGGLITSIIGILLAIAMVVMGALTDKAMTTVREEVDAALEDGETSDYMKEIVLSALIAELESSGLSEDEVREELLSLCEGENADELRETLKALGMESYADMIIEAIEEEYGKPGDDTDESRLPDLNDESIRLECTDGSTMFLNSDTSYSWYMDYDDENTAYQSGTYALCYGDAALEMITEDLESYAVTAQEMEDYFERNEGDSFYNKDNFCVFITYVDVLDQGNGNELTETQMIPFYGFFDGQTMDIVCLNSANTYVFSVEQ